MDDYEDFLRRKRDEHVVHQQKIVERQTGPEALKLSQEAFDHILNREQCAIDNWSEAIEKYNAMKASAIKGL